MGCKQLFVNLGGGGGGSVNTGVLQIAGGVALDSTLRFVEDQNGTDSILKLSTTQAELSSSTNKILTLSGGSAPYISWGSDNQYIQGFLSSPSVGIQIGVNSGAKVLNLKDADGAAWGGGSITQNGAFTIKGAGGNIISFRNTANVEVGYIDNNGRFKGSDFLSDDLSAGSLTTAKAMKFGDKATVTDAGLTALGLDAQIAIEHNGQVYYVPVSTSQFS